jgi:cytochrome c biogenesis protein CcmG/thiol:disulfide interchange protein DsbE
MRRMAIVTFLIVVAVVVAVAATTGGDGEGRGKRAPALPRQVLVPPRVDIRALRGKPAVINFWASWCRPCKREAPDLERLSHSLAGKARLVGIDWGDSADGARAFIRRYHWTFPNLRDGSNTVGNRFGLLGLPTTFILDSKGRIAVKIAGPQTVRRVEAALRSVH